MAINYTSDIMSLYSTNVATEAAYQAPGTYGLPTTAISSGIGPITIGGTNNAYTSAPTFSLSDAGGTGAGFAGTVRMKLASIALNAAGTGYTPLDTITLTSGTPVSVDTRAIVTVATTKVVSATIAAGGTGYGNAQTFAAVLVGGTGTPAQLNVTSNAGGVITTINSVSVAGSYTVNPSLAGVATTGGAGTGFTANVVIGVATVTIANAGQYTAVATSATQGATQGNAGAGGLGTGATFNTMTFSVDSVFISNPGSGYTGALTGSFSGGNATAVVAYSAGGAAETRILTLIEVVRSFIASAGSAEEANNARDVLMRMMSRVNTGGTFSAATTATRVQKAGVVRFAKRKNNF